MTSAIIPVHCYGNPCAVQRIQQIADNYGLKVIYDAAHAFGIKDQGGSILRYGDLAVLSFHATKVFSTFEGGAISCPDAKTKQRIDYLKNFGFADEVTVVAPGINGKMNEFQAAFGLLQLKHIEAAVARRKVIDAKYRRELCDIKGVWCLPLPEGVVHNHSYFPIFVDSGFSLSREALYHLYRERNIYARRYFYPLISDFPMYRGLPSAAAANLPMAKKMADEVLCLPIYPALKDEEQDRVIAVIKDLT
jgi:dTDP-4-amino-4,6-dideoxygalactose transaminase